MAKLLFCPFCRECFEDADRCPDHDLPLVPFEQLPAAPREQEDDGQVPMLDPARGRLELVLAAIGLLLGFLVPLVEVSAAGRTQTFSALAAAAERAPNLWAIPIAGALFASLVGRRRTPLQMRGARLAGIVVALAPIVSLVYSIRRMIMAASLEHGVSVSIAWGAYLIGLSALLGIVGSVRFGGALRAHGTAPSSPDSGVSPRG
ncbi:MAG: hypothetical protein K1X94_35695 [Sandaracinaceae bacterium]|nr:hypothetical protein [Sandaracinaceae bacterium]